VEVVLAQQPVVGVTHHREVGVVAVSVHMVWCVVLEGVGHLPGVRHVFQEPLPDAGARVLGYVREYQLVLVAHYHVCI
jgi:hypothetical protein